MADAPKRIWTTGSTSSGSWNDKPTNFGKYAEETEYVRADIADELADAAWNAAIESAANVIATKNTSNTGIVHPITLSDIEYIRDLAKYRTP